MQLRVFFITVCFSAATATILTEGNKYYLKKYKEAVRAGERECHCTHVAPCQSAYYSALEMTMGIYMSEMPCYAPPEKCEKDTDKLMVDDTFYCVGRWLEPQPTTTTTTYSFTSTTSTTETNDDTYSSSSTQQPQAAIITTQNPTNPQTTEEISDETLMRADFMIVVFVVVCLFVLGVAVFAIARERSKRRGRAPLEFSNPGFDPSTTLHTENDSKKEAENATFVNPVYAGAAVHPPAKHPVYDFAEKIDMGIVDTQPTANPAEKEHIYEVIRNTGVDFKSLSEETQTESIMNEGYDALPRCEGEETDAEMLEQEDGSLAVIYAQTAPETPHMLPEGQYDNANNAHE